MKLNLPPCDLSVKKDEEGNFFVYDVVRKSYVALTPEEYVRQHMIHYLIAKNYPRALFSIEKSLKYNHLHKRNDILVYGREMVPLLLVECKAPNVAITDDTLKQLALYNSVLQSPFIGISNGLDTIFWQMSVKKASWVKLDRLPNYEELI